MAAQGIGSRKVAPYFSVKLFKGINNSAATIIQIIAFIFGYALHPLWWLVVVPTTDIMSRQSIMLGMLNHYLL